MHLYGLSINESRSRNKKKDCATLQVSTSKCTQVTMDLVVNLLESNLYSAVVMLVGQLKNIVHFRPYNKEGIGTGYPTLFVDTVFSSRKMP